MFYNRAQHVTESTRHKYNTSHTHTFRGDQTREERGIVMISGVYMISLHALMTGDGNTRNGDKVNKKYPNILCLFTYVFGKIRTFRVDIISELSRK